MKAGRKRRQTKHSALADLPPACQIDAVCYGDVYTSDPEAFELGAAWARLAFADSPQLNWWTRIIGTKGLATFRRTLEQRTGDFLLALCKAALRNPSATNRLRRVADAIDRQFEPGEKDPVLSAILNVAIDKDPRFWFRECPRVLPFDYAYLRVYLDRLGIKASKATVYNGLKALGCEFRRV